LPSAKGGAHPTRCIPGYGNLQRDVEAYLSSTGMRQKRPGGFVVCRGFDEALALLFNEHLSQRAYDSLVCRFRT